MIEAQPVAMIDEEPRMEVPLPTIGSLGSAALSSELILRGNDPDLEATLRAAFPSNYRSAEATPPDAHTRIPQISREVLGGIKAQKRRRERYLRRNR